VNIFNGQAFAGRAPRVATIGTLKNGIPIRARVESGRNLGIDGQRNNRSFGETCPSPGFAPSAALEDPSYPRWSEGRKAYVERGRRPGGVRNTADSNVIGKASPEGGRGAASTCALDDTITSCCVLRRMSLRVECEGGDSPAFRPIARPDVLACGGRP